MMYTMCVSPLNTPTRCSRVADEWLVLYKRLYRRSIFDGRQTTWNWCWIYLVDVMSRCKRVRFYILHGRNVIFTFRHISSAVAWRTRWSGRCVYNKVEIISLTRESKNEPRLLSLFKLQLIPFVWQSLSESWKSLPVAQRNVDALSAGTSLSPAWLTRIPFIHLLTARVLPLQHIKLIKYIFEKIAHN